ncbi:MAG: major capsid protein [Arizlama microvirus]|nr:MAG: major capsid protein [Arizlama microvirus]
MNIRTKRQPSANVHQFAMVPKPDVPRSSFRIQKTHKTTFDASWLVPIYVDEVLPGDTFHLNMTAFCRMQPTVFPVMDNLYLESFFFFVPNRLLWSNWVKFMGEQVNPADSISFTVPQVTSPVGGWAVGGLFDHLGVPVAGQIPGGNTITVNALPRRAYWTIYNQWFRDENLNNSIAVSMGDGPDGAGDGLVRRNKRHDYFTSALPWTQKGGIAVQIPLGTTAPVKTGISHYTSAGAVTGMMWGAAAAPNAPLGGSNFIANQTGTGLAFSTTNAATLGGAIVPTNLYADLSQATAATINQLRQSFQIQRLLERDARGGTRYQELIRAHFGVISPDARLQRPEYLGGGRIPINISPVPQTSGTGLTGGTTPLGALSGVGTAAGSNGFTQSFTEHGYILGLINVRADLTYQQGIRKMWSRSTRYDFYFPAFAHLGEQAILNREIYADGSANDSLVFGYQERWAEYRYNPSEITGLFRSTSAGTIDGWHLAQRFVALPTLNSTFIADAPPIERVISAGAAAVNAQFIGDFFFDIKAARPLPLYSVPGLIDHF